jgi:hypothetical protein
MMPVSFDPCGQLSSFATRPRMPRTKTDDSSALSARKDPLLLVMPDGDFNDLPLDLGTITIPVKQP